MNKKYTYMKTLMNLILLFIFTPCFSCTDNDDTGDDGFDIIGGAIKVSMMETDKTMYKTGENVSCSFTIENPVRDQQNIKEVLLTLRNCSNKDNPFHRIGQSLKVAENIVLEAGETKTIDVASFYTVNNDVDVNTACGVYVDCIFDDGSSSQNFGTFFRVVNDKSLTTYEIYEDNYNGLPVYKLDGGMSAEFGVEKAITSFGKGVSHSWFCPYADNNGPNPVWSTPDFLRLSLQKTVDLYNKVLGSETAKIKTVILGVGVPSVPYVCTTMNAAYLPVHFLASVNSTVEIEAILDYSNRHVCSSYATLGYDGSMPDAGVAWIKMLELPEEYKKFIEDHGVEEVILYGLEEGALGPTLARKVLRSQGGHPTDLEPGTIYLLYSENSTDYDTPQLVSRIRDYNTVRKGPSTHTADWESGIPDKELEGLILSTKSQTQAGVYSVMSSGSSWNTILHLYNVAYWLSLKYMVKNKEALNTNAITGITINEYLSSNPQYELAVGRVPYLYWQFNDVSTIISRIFNEDLKKAIQHYYATNLDNIKGSIDFYLDSNYQKLQLRDGIINKGVPQSHIFMREGNQDVWLGTGNTLVEKYAEDIVNRIGLTAYIQKLSLCEPITLEEFAEICELVGTSDDGLRFNKH